MKKQLPKKGERWVYNSKFYTQVVEIIRIGPDHWWDDRDYRAKTLIIIPGQPSYKHKNEISEITKNIGISANYCVGGKNWKLMKNQNVKREK